MKVARMLSRSMSRMGSLSTVVPAPGESPSRSEVNALILSLVHPDYLAPLYSVAKVLRDAGYHVHLFSFSSPVPSTTDLGQRIEFHDIGQHSGSIGERLRARRRFTHEVLDWSNRRRPTVVFASCPFSLLLALRTAGANAPVVYLSFEMYEVSWSDFRRSPATSLRNWRARRSLRKVSLVCVPSEERAVWLQRRARLTERPQVVLNAPYAEVHPSGGPCASTKLCSLLPNTFLHRPLVVHTGNCSNTQAVLELIESMQWWPDDAALVLTSVGDTAYSRLVRERASLSPRSDDILLLSQLPRDQMLALQRSSTVGVCLIRNGDNLESSMPAPNKVGEYLHAGLLVVGLASPYMNMLADHGVAVLSPTLELEAIGTAVTLALRQSSLSEARSRILAVACSWYDMRVQFEPVLRHLRTVIATSSAVRD
jgi:hypothetical protein